MKVRLCLQCYEEYTGRRCPICAPSKEHIYHRFHDLMDRLIDLGGVTEEQSDAFLIMVKEWLATHWTERENPAHEVMEAVCQ